MNNYGNAILYIAQYSNRTLSSLFRMTPAELQAEVQTIIINNTAAVDEINRIVPVIDGWVASATDTSDELNTCTGFDNAEITALNTQLDNYHLFHADEHTTVEQWNEYSTILKDRFEHFNDNLNNYCNELINPDADYNKPMEVTAAITYYNANLTDEEKGHTLEDAHDELVQRLQNDVNDLDSKIDAIDSIINPQIESTNYQDRDASYVNAEVPTSPILTDLIDSLTDEERRELESHRNPAGNYTYVALEEFRDNTLHQNLSNKLGNLATARRAHQSIYDNSRDSLDRTFNEVTHAPRQVQANPAREWACMTAGICAGVVLRTASVALGISPVADVVVTGYGIARNIYNGFIRDNIQNHDNAIVRIADTVFGPSQNRDLGKFLDGLTLGWSVSRIASSVGNLLNPTNGTPTGGVTPPDNPVVPNNTIGQVPSTPTAPTAPSTLSTTGISGYFDSYGNGPVDLIDGINGQLAETNNGFQLLREVGTNTPIAWLSPEQVAQATQNAAGALTKTL